MLPIALTLVVAGIGIAYGISVVDDIGDSIGDDACGGYWNSTSQVCQVSDTNATALSSNPTSYNASADTLTGVAKLPNKLPLIVTVIVAAIIIGILVRYLMFR